MARRQTLVALAASAALAGLAGCTGRGPALPATVPAKGVLILPDGQPLREGRVELSPKGKGGVEAFGDVKPDGSFTLTSYKPGDGAVPGRYVLSIDPYNYAGPGGNPRPIASSGRIPARYLDSGTSGYEVEIKPPDADLQVRLGPS